jgi:hypothetical protein
VGDCDGFEVVESRGKDNQKAREKSSVKIVEEERRTARDDVGLVDFGAMMMTVKL